MAEKRLILRLLSHSVGALIILSLVGSEGLAAGWMRSKTAQSRPKATKTATAAKTKKTSTSKQSPKKPASSSRTTAKSNAKRTKATSTAKAKKPTSRSRRASTTRPGSRIPSERVIEIQNALITRGYLQGPPSGVYDNDTVAAMKKFQQAEDIDATGYPTAHALNRLGLTPGLEPRSPGNSEQR